jgi:hypothetical protein
MLGGSGSKRRCLYSEQQGRRLGIHHDGHGGPILHGLAWHGMAWLYRIMRKRGTYADAASFARDWHHSPVIGINDSCL